MMGGAHDEDGVLEDVSSPVSKQQQQQQQGAAGWGWGSWGNSALSVLSDLQKAAAEAAEEISKNAMEAAKGAAKGVAELQTTVAESLVDKKDAEVPEADEDAEESVSPSERMRKSALRKLEGASKDSALGHGLKVLDNSVENLAAGAFQALGTAWKGSVSLVQKLENSAEQFAGTIQGDTLTAKAGALAPKLIQSGKELTVKGIKALEYVGKETMDILALEAGINMEDQNQRSDAENTLEDATFDRCFYIYGGPEHLEELEALSNHYTLLCNRAKAKMSGDQRAAFDGLVNQLSQVLTLGPGTGDNSPGSDKGKQVEKGSLGYGTEMKSLRDSSVRKAAEMATSFTATLGGLAVTEVVQKTADRIEAIKAEGVHRLSEVCAVCVSHLLLLGKSLLASCSDDSQVKETYEWPEDCLAKALLIRTRARDMASDIEAVSDSFVTGIGDVTAAFQAALKNEIIVSKDGDRAPMKESSMEDTAHAVSSDLQSDGSAAIGKLQDGLQQLVYVVLSTSLKN